MWLPIWAMSIMSVRQSVLHDRHWIWASLLEKNNTIEFPKKRTWFVLPPTSTVICHGLLLSFWKWEIYTLLTESNTYCSIYPFLVAPLIYFWMNVSQRKSATHLASHKAKPQRETKKKCPEEKGYETQRMGLTAAYSPLCSTVGKCIEFCS